MAKKSHHATVHKMVGTWCGAAEWPVNARACHGFSYRELWIQEGCPGTFEAWLASKGVIAN